MNPQPINLEKVPRQQVPFSEIPYGGLFHCDGIIDGKDGDRFTGLLLKIRDTRMEPEEHHLIMSLFTGAVLLKVIKGTIHYYQFSDETLVVPVNATLQVED